MSLENPSECRSRDRIEVLNYKSKKIRDMASTITDFCTWIEATLFETY